MTAIVSPLIEPIVRPAVRLPGSPGDRLPSLDEIVRSLPGFSPALILDFGDERCDPGSGQTVYDLSGNGRNFFVGLNGLATSTDPARVGPAGLRHRDGYLLHDGGDMFLFAAANDAYLNGLHKNNAVHTWAWLEYYPTISASTRLLCTARLSGDVGIRYFVDASAKLTISFNNAAGFQTLHTSTAALTGNAWNFLAISFDEAGTSFVNINGTVETFPGAITSPSSSNASKTVSLFAHENATSAVQNGTRSRLVYADNTALTQAQVAALRERVLPLVA